MTGSSERGQHLGATDLKLRTSCIALAAALALSVAAGFDPLTARAVDEPGPPPVGQIDAVQAGQPDQRLIAFLRSPVGVIATILGVGLVGLSWVGASALALRQAERTRPVPKARRRRRAEPHPAGESIAQPASLRVLAGVVTGAALVLPVTFAIASEDVFALPKTIALWSVAGAALAAMMVGAARGVRLVPLDIVTVSALTFAGLTALATGLSINPGHSLVGERLQYQGLVSTSAYVVLFIGARAALTRVRHVRLLSIAILASAVFAAVYALAQWFGLDPIWAELFKGRVFSTIGQANALATTLATAIVLALALFGGANRFVLTTVGATLAVIVGALVVTFSRGGYVALVIGLAVAGAALLRTVTGSVVRPVVPRLLGALVAVVVTIGVIAAIWQPAGDLVGRVAARTASIANASESSNRAHLDLWAVGIRITVDHPIVGTGPDTYPMVFPRYRDEVLPPDRAQVLAQFRPESPHNVYIAIASGSGLPALAAYLAVIGTVLLAGVRAVLRPLPMNARLAIAGLLGAATVHLVTNLFVTAEPATFAIFWVILGTLAGVSSGLPSAPAAAETSTAPAR